MSRWNDLLGRTNQTKIKTDYVSKEFENELKNELLNQNNKFKSHDVYKNQMWTVSLSKQADSLCDRLFECFEDMDPYEAMDCRDIDMDTQKRALYEALVTTDIDDIITDLEDYKSACVGDDPNQCDKIQKLLDDVLQFKKDVDSHYVKQYDPHYAISIGTEHDTLEKRDVKEQQSRKQNVYSNVNPKNIVKVHSKHEKDDKEK